MIGRKKLKLTYAQFRVLTAIEGVASGQSKSDIVKYLTTCEMMDRYLVEEIIHAFVNFGLVTLDMRVTRKGYKYLEPFRVKRAIFLAAGFGSRMHPITVNTPKPLVRINGDRIIDTLINAALRAGIKEIIIVRGYLKDSFDALKAKYPMIKFVDNPDFHCTNNISSIFYARHYLKNAYIFESDIYLKDTRLIPKYQYSSNYLGIYKDKTDDWCFTTKGEIITSQVIGGEDCYQEIGLSYWSNEDGQKLSEDIYDAYVSGACKQMFWDQIPFSKAHINDYKIRVRPCSEDAVIEIDTLEDLKALDDAYVSAENVKVKP